MKIKAKIDESVVKYIVTENCKFYSNVTAECFAEFCIEEMEMDKKSTCKTEEYIEKFNRFKEQFFGDFKELLLDYFIEFVEEYEGEEFEDEKLFVEFKKMTLEDNDYLNNMAESTDGYSPAIIQSNDFVLFLDNIKDELLESFGDTE